MRSPTARQCRPPDENCCSVTTGPLPLLAVLVKKSTILGIRSTAVSFFLVCAVSLSHADSGGETTLIALPAGQLYETGQVYNLMREKGGAGVVLNDLMLLENDGPGAGFSEKGHHTESLHAGVRTKKVFHLADARVRSCHVVLYLELQDPNEHAPYYLFVNDRRVEGIAVPWHEGRWHWVPVPSEYLREGANEIVVACDAPPGKGYDLLFAREDEYERGGGRFTYRGNTGLLSAGFVPLPEISSPRAPLPDGFERIDVGATSFRSTDGGLTWRGGLLGPDANVRGEYTIRLHRERYHEHGELLSAPIDLWSDARGKEGGACLVPRSTVEQLRVACEGDVPAATEIGLAVRLSPHPDPESTAWSQWTPLTPDGRVADPPPAARFLQLRASLSTTSPLTTPVLRSLQIRSVLSRAPVPDHTFYVRSRENPSISRPSYPHRFEPPESPELAALAQRLNLAEVVRGAVDDFDRINRLRHHVSGLWRHTLALPGYPEWNALDILHRRDTVGSGGMCQQFTIVFMQALQSLGYPARSVNVFNHEAHEVFVPSLAKWVAVDPESLFDSYEYDTETGEPLSVLEQHQHFLRRYGFGADRPIPWMSPEPWCNWPSGKVVETPQPLAISTFTPWLNHPEPTRRPPQHGLAGFVRIVPRSDFFARPTPRPLCNGSTYWPWNGYLCWYDAATPRKLPYALHTDRVADLSPPIFRTAFAAAHGEVLGDVTIQLQTLTPNFESFEVRRGGGAWEDTPSEFTWKLRPCALNRIEMRARNAFGIRGVPSHLEVFWHYQAPYSPRPADETKPP